MPRTRHHAAVSRSVSRTSGLTLRGKPRPRREHRQLAGEVVDVPAHRVAEQHRRLVVEIVTGDDDVVAAVERRRVEQLALRQPARRARHAAGGHRRGRHVVAVARRAGRSPCRFSPRSAANARGVPAALVGVLTDAETDVQPVGLVAGLDQHVPHGEASPCRRSPRRAPARVGSQHVEVVDRLGHLAPAQLLQVLGTEVGVVPRQVDDRRPLAHLALGPLTSAPPEMTGRTSIVSASSSRASPGTSVPLRITRCASRFSPRSSSSRSTVRAASTSISRRGFRSRIITRSAAPLLLGGSIVAGRCASIRTNWPGLSFSSATTSGSDPSMRRSTLRPVIRMNTVRQKRSSPNTPLLMLARRR